MEVILLQHEKYKNETRHKNLADLQKPSFGQTIMQRKVIDMSYSRSIYSHVCPICGEIFEAIKTAITCSSACRKQRQRLVSR